MAGSKGGRTYSDPSYGSMKKHTFQRVSMGTRAADTAELAAGIFTALNPIEITDWAIYCSATGDGGTSTWILKKGTVALGTLSFVTNPTAGTTVVGTAITTSSANICSVGDDIFLYTGLSTAAPQPFVTVSVNYRERFLDSDN